MIEAIAPASEVARTAIEWNSVALSDGLIENLQTGFACGNHNQTGSGIVHVRPYNVTTDGKMDFGTLKFIPLSEASKPERLLHRDDVIFNNTNSPELVGKTALYTDSDSRAFSNHMTRLRVNRQKVRPRYLALALHQLWREGYFADKCNNHVSQASIGRSVLLETEIPLPTVDEQDRVIAAVDALEVRVKTARENLHGVPGLLKKFRQSVLAAACAGQLTADWRDNNPRPQPSPSISELGMASKAKTRRGVCLNAELDENLLALDLPETWELATVSALLVAGALADVKDGNHGANHPKASEYSDSGMPFIMANHVIAGRIDYENAPKIEGQALDRIRVGKSCVGDVILTHKGSVGRVAVATRDSILTPQTTYYRCNEQFLHPPYLALFLESVFYYNQVAKIMSQTTRDFVPISDQYLQTIIVPPIEEQKEIVHRVESLFALADSIESHLADATEQVERTTQAILAKAFRGELC